MQSKLPVAAIVILMALAGCSVSPKDPVIVLLPGDPPVQGGIEPPAARSSIRLSGYQLTEIVPLPNDDLLLVERQGRVHLLPQGSKTPELLLNLTDRIDIQGERGLSSLALHPDFEKNGIIFVAYTKTTNEETREGFSELTRYRADPNDIRASWVRLEVLLSQDWTQWFHNTADLKFGPDGMLYMGVADGSRGRMAAQDLGVLNGKILRLDVDQAPGYRVPANNPFVDKAGARPEIFLYGLRNPWRMDFHPVTGDLYMAAVGESNIESVYLFPKDGNAPRNHGWPYLEGSQRFEEYDAPPEAVNLPIAEYDRPDGSGLCAIIGGTIYKGDLFPTLRGQFVFIDHCLGQVMFTQKVGSEWHITSWIQLKDEYATSVDSDANGEIMVSTLHGRVYSIVPT